MFNLVIALASDFFFSKLAKYLLFFSFCSIICAFGRVIKPFNLFSKILFNSFRLLSKFDFILSCNSESSALLNSFSSCSMSLVYFISFLRFSFFFNDAYLIVSFHTVPFIISHSVFGFASLLIVAISLMLSLIVC